MAKDPAFLFYPNDYLGGTLGMSFEEKGAYIELLMTQFNRGHLSEKIIINIVGNIWEVLKDKFIKDENGLFYNVRLDEEKIKRQNYSQSRRNNILGKNQHKVGHMSNDMLEHTKGHMVNVNEDVNKDKNKSKKNRVFKIPTIEEVINYFEENKYTKKSAESFYNFYSVADWIDSKGNKVKNWKQKAQGIWFKDENKSIEQPPKPLGDYTLNKYTNEWIHTPYNPRVDLTSEVHNPLLRNPNAK